MGEDEEGDFQSESFSRYGVNLLGKVGRELAEAGFNTFTKVLYQKALRWVVWAAAVLTSGTLLLTATGLVKEVFRYVVRVEHAACG